MSHQTELPKKSKLDIAGILVYVLIVSVFLFVWILTGVMETPISEEAAELAEQKAILYSLTESGSAEFVFLGK